MVGGGKSEGSVRNLGSIVKRVGELGHVSFSCENDSDGRAARSPNDSLWMRKNFILLSKILWVA